MGLLSIAPLLLKEEDIIDVFSTTTPSVQKKVSEEDGEQKK
jgi:hypothetical protein